MLSRSFQEKGYYSYGKINSIHENAILQIFVLSGRFSTYIFDIVVISKVHRFLVKVSKYSRSKIIMA